MYLADCSYTGYLNTFDVPWGFGYRRTCSEYYLAHIELKRKCEPTIYVQCAVERSCQQKSIHYSRVKDTFPLWRGLCFGLVWKRSFRVATRCFTLLPVAIVYRAFRYCQPFNYETCWNSAAGWIPPDRANLWWTKGMRPSPNLRLFLTMGWKLLSPI